MNAATVHARAEVATSAGLAGVVLVAMPGRVPREVKRMRQHLETLVSQVWTIPWLPAWTVEFDPGVPDDQIAPQIAALRADISELVDDKQRAVPEISSTDDIGDTGAAAPAPAPRSTSSVTSTHVGAGAAAPVIDGAADAGPESAEAPAEPGSATTASAAAGWHASIDRGVVALVVLMVLGLVGTVVGGVALLRGGDEARPVSATERSSSVASSESTSPSATPSSTPSASPRPLPRLRVTARAATARVGFRITPPRAPAWVTVDVDPAARGAKSVRKVIRVTSRRPYAATVTGLPAGKASWMVSSRGARRAEGVVRVKPRPRGRQTGVPADGPPAVQPEDPAPPPADPPPSSQPTRQQEPPPTGNPGGPVDPDETSGPPGGPIDPDSRIAARSHVLATTRQELS